MAAAVVSTGPPGEGLLPSADDGLGNGPSADLGFVQQVPSFLCDDCNQNLRNLVL